MDQAAFAHHFENTFPDLVGTRVLVSLSGGADSVALLHLLRSKELQLDLEAAHVHHGIRGDEADGDAAFCEALCTELGVPFHLLRIDPGELLDSGREATWRHFRYRCLLDLKRTRAFDAVATGHHRDDVAEGVLVQLLRGSGPRALAGIGEATDDGVIRPLLAWSHAGISRWLEEHGLGWREDSSNRDPRHLRNRVRHQLLPTLEAASPALRSHLVHLAGALAADDRYLTDQLISQASWIDPWEPDGGVPLASVAGLPPPLRTRWLHAQARQVNLSRVSRRQAELFETLLGGEGPRAVTLDRRWRIRIAGGKLWLEPPETPAPYTIKLREGIRHDLPLPGWQVRLGPATDPEPGIRWRFRTIAGARLLVRSPRADDRVEVDGQLIRIKKLLARALPRHLRNAWPVCCENDRILWIPGVWRGPEPAIRSGHVVEVMRCERSSCVV